MKDGMGINSINLYADLIQADASGLNFVSFDEIVDTDILYFSFHYFGAFESCRKKFGYQTHQY
jgi:hypothetical protein